MASGKAKGQKNGSGREIWRASWRSLNFEFEYYSQSEIGAREGLIMTWRRHCAEYRVPVRLTRDEGDCSLATIREEMYVYRIDVGAGYRDFMPIY